ncbi:hypothetical protein QJU89_02430 [Pasteurella skyensis]|uniref:Uncharacterized protein n=1 Tax=Phocoenobacter skyensis TaxID=97481 RepID=A0AAJ6N8R0_9PAST|nr:hypothetical protein [Pasteurella skyensis]MDP8162369.1 hypothetical protein [Pasteurella skyensis]MDP8172297.1 hypothetical protein [Pasteurella skyensis]MDP8178552.1 hypothetical protein [Pasteurella skyensis]MDP8182554.1 hypothetical protein [Pasteurella skyensis]MDP8188859.1 hypothetical protein [Pasteurella skyensis]
MSAVIKTITPFIDKECLLKALESIGCQYNELNNRIVVQHNSFRYIQHYFELKNGKYEFTYDSYSSSINKFLQNIEVSYKHIYQEKLAELERQRLESERIRLEEERKEFVKQQKESIKARAKEMGYSIKETTVQNKVKLVLVKHSY